MSSGRLSFVQPKLHERSRAWGLASMVLEADLFCTVTRRRAEIDVLCHPAALQRTKSLTRMSTTQDRARALGVCKQPQTGTKHARGMTKPTVLIEIAHFACPKQAGVRATMGGCRRRREQRSLKWPAHYTPTIHTYRGRRVNRPTSMIESFMCCPSCIVRNRSAQAVSCLSNVGEP